MASTPNSPARDRVAQVQSVLCLAVPLTTAVRASRWRLAIGTVAGKEAYAVLSQLRNLDSLRLYQKIGHIDADLLQRIRKAASRMNFG